MSDNTYDNEKSNENVNINIRNNLFQIFKQHETVYIFKIILYIVMVCVIIYDMNTSFRLLQESNGSQSHHMFTAFIVLLLTTLIDEVVLFANCKLKSGKAQVAQYVFMIIVIACLAFGALIFFDVVPVLEATVVVCCWMSMLCCVSPLFELLCDFLFRIQDETSKKILET